MNLDDANKSFEEAHKLFREKNYPEALKQLEFLNDVFPENHRVLSALARTLDKVGRHDEAREVCNHLVNDMGYDKVRPLHRHLMAKLVTDALPYEDDDDDIWDMEKPGAETSSIASDSEDLVDAERSFLSKVPFIRLAILAALCAGMYFGYVNVWLGGGLIVFYFVVVLGIKWIIMKVFTAPFKMKGAVLAGAMAQVHSVTPAPAPPNDDSDDGHDDGPMRYVWLDVTITPQADSGKFTHWEPGELALIPHGLKAKATDLMDHSFAVRDTRIFAGGQEREDDGEKYQGAMRLKLLVALPGQGTRYEFLYYFERFGEIRVGV